MANLGKLFEVSWQVCNFINEVHIALSSKASHAVKNFKDSYLLIGPLLDVNDGFVEAPDLFTETIQRNLHKNNLQCRFGYWDVEGKPKVILVDYKNQYNANDLLYLLWKDFGVESLDAQPDYLEMVTFSTAAAEVIETIAQLDETETFSIFAHFHEWRTGAGLLYLKKNQPSISSVFTLYSTVLGQALAGRGLSIFDLPYDFNFMGEARALTLFAKYSLELAAAREADCLTTVSHIAVDEANIVLKQYSDKITLNGLNLDDPAINVDEQQKINAREKLKDVANKILGLSLPETTKIWMTSGQDDFHVNGYDVLLASLNQLETKLDEASPPLVIFFFVGIKQLDKKSSLVDTHTEIKPGENVANVLTHSIENPHANPILNQIKHLNLDDPKRKIHVIYCPAFLNGKDGVFDFHYYTLLSACDLSIYPSFYQPWGYQPLESIACGVPTVTTDLSGFGNWIRMLSVDSSDVVHIIPRHDIHDNEFTAKLTDFFAVQISKKNISSFKIQAKALGKFADWKYFYRNYLDAYEQAFDTTAVRINETYLSKFGEEISNDIVRISNRTTKIHSLNVEYVVSDEWKELVKFSYNLWWSWQDKAYQLFMHIDPVLWEEVKNNPIQLLNRTSRENLREKISNEEFAREFNHDLEDLKNYCQERPDKKFDLSLIDDKHPIAYFCMEYGLHESLPLYAGGLGILAGDHLKTASDMQLPLVAVGLLYKYGYFNQRISLEGFQIATPDFIDPYNTPVILLKNKSGKEILIQLELPGRICYLRVWQVNIGRVILYLLDTDISLNNNEDRKITAKLYPPDSELRLIQGITLGIGGVKLIHDVLKLNPAVFHMNECHTAYLVLERMKNLIKEGFTVNESVEIVRKTTVYTIHTSIAAAEEIYTQETMKKYFTEYMGKIGITMADMLAQGKSIYKDNAFFSLTASAIRTCFSVNAVSKLHGRVSRKLWQDLWLDILESEVPISSVTNGVHTQSWLGLPMRALYDEYFPKDWLMDQCNADIWENVHKIPDKKIWDTHQLQKKHLIDAVKKRVLSEYILRGEEKKLIDKTLSNLHPDALIIGFSRRFAQYKRPTLIFKNQKRLAEALNQSGRPVVILMSGKAYPFDNVGSGIVHDIIQQTRNEMFGGRIIFIENYDIAVARFLVSGVDVWLNNPVYPLEACGTSGMKAAMNGAINYSIKDGWWDEAYTPDIGWNIDTYEAKHVDEHKHDDLENYFLFNKLENDIIPEFFSESNEGYPSEWVKKMKASIALVGQRFNSQRMLRDYFNQLYLPAAYRGEVLMKESGKNAKEYLAWKNQIQTFFKSIKVQKIRIHWAGASDETNVTGPLDISIKLYTAGIPPENLSIDLILMKTSRSEKEAKSFTVPLQLAEKSESGLLTYVLKYEFEENGLYAYAIRITPSHPFLRHPTELGLVLWI